jgi:hypothetical protein
LELDGSWLDVVKDRDELVAAVGRTVGSSGATGYGLRPRDRMPVYIGALTCLGWPAGLVWIKRRYRSIDTDCNATPGPGTPAT